VLHERTSSNVCDAGAECDGSKPDPGAIKGLVVLRIVSVLATAGLVLLGVWVTGGLLTDDFKKSAALTTLFFVLAGAAALGLAKARRDLGIPVLLTFVVVSTAVGGYLAYTTLVDKEVEEALVAGDRVAEGTFRDYAHATTGRARIVRSSGRAKLQLVDLDTDAGPDLRVYLVPGGYEGGDVEDHVDLGALKGNRGTQQYDLRAGVDTDRYSTVLIWCRAFSVAFGAADLTST
jgi:Electron transfer DM13